MDVIDAFILIWLFGTMTVFYRYTNNENHTMLPAVLTAMCWPILVIIVVWLLIFDYKDISQD